MQNSYERNHRIERRGSWLGFLMNSLTWTGLQVVSYAARWGALLTASFRTKCDGTTSLQEVWWRKTWAQLGAVVGSCAGTCECLGTD